MLIYLKYICIKNFLNIIKILVKICIFITIFALELLYLNLSFKHNKAILELNSKSNF